MYLNDVYLAGVLARQPEARQTENGFDVTHAVVQLEDESDDGRMFKTYVPLIAWGKSAQVLAGMQEGKPVLVKGRLRYRSWEGQDGKKAGRLEVSSFQVQAIPGPAETMGAA